MTRTLCGTNKRKKSLTGLEEDINVFTLAVVGEFVVVAVVIVMRFSFKMPYAPYLNSRKFRSLLEGFWETENFRSANFYIRSNM